MYVPHSSYHILDLSLGASTIGLKFCNGSLPGADGIWGRYRDHKGPEQHQTKQKELLSPKSMLIVFLTDYRGVTMEGTLPTYAADS